MTNIKHSYTDVHGFAATGDINGFGLGARLITRSVLVFRADLATGDEDHEAPIIVDYPWEVL